MNVYSIKPGDRITFKAQTREHCRKATRVVTGAHRYGVMVKSYNGWSDFVVKANEILEHHPQVKGSR